MKNLAILTSVLFLAACGGGSGGVGAPGNITNPRAVDVQTSNANVSSSFSNAEKRIATAQNNYAAAGQDLPTMAELHTDSNTPNNSQPRKATSRKSFAGYSHAAAIETLIDAMYANMYYWLIEDGNRIPNSAEERSQYKHALILAGFIGLNFDNFNNMNINDITDAVNDSGIIQQANALYTELGTLKTFDGTDIEWFTSPDNTGANDKITFVIDKDNQKVTGINYVANENIPSRERTIEEMTRKGDTNTYTAKNVRIFQYGLNNIECIGPCPDPTEQNYANKTYDPEAHLHGGRSLDISITEELATPEQIKERLLAEIQLAYEEGMFHNFHNAVKEDESDNHGNINQDLIAERLRDAAIERVNNWENETNKIEEYIDLDIKNDLTTYGKLVGLAYSDFGVMNLTMKADGFNQTDSKLIYGGYDAKKIDPANFVEQNMEFNGIAKGHVVSSIEENHSDNVLSSKPKTLEDNNAKLVFNPTNQQETLTMSFKNNNWYDVVVTKDSLHNPSITFTDNTATSEDPESKIANDYRFIGHQSGNVYEIDNFTQTNQNVDFNNDGITGSKGGTLGIAYYGAQEHNPSEAVGYVTYQESEPYRTDPNDWEAHEIKRIEFEAGFGMQKNITKKNITE